MDEKTKIFVDQVGEFLKTLLKERELTAEQLSKDIGMNKQQLYAVLRMGDPARPDYKISTLVRVLSGLQVHLEFHDMHERSNQDLLPDKSKPGKN